MQVVQLPKDNPEVMKASCIMPTEVDNYIVIDQRPKLNEYYINMFMVESSRAIFKHTHPRHLKNHKKDYRFAYCCIVVASDNPKFNLPTCKEYLKTINS